jgi:CubicO group peptidase (beta-lactamase class C family)
MRTAIPARAKPRRTRTANRDHCVTTPTCRRSPTRPAGAYSTAADLLNFAQAVSSHRLLGKALTDTVLAGKVDSAKPGGPPNEKYAYGFSDASINGVRIVGHNGGTPGYEAQLDIYPGRGYVVVLLANQDRVLVPAIQRSEEMLTR